ncbi:rCG40777, isoform CRA_b [Rattus norvegicus]|uniref:RCG40777, isoform CRA_b n=1 Tax=Rattus norvegicus TaxID=10116 RepID=A6KNY1_RAT|nr:rCG40777, isoform CRA_b [Rattus norvegicus]EDL83745.1 rCG40777, isoform CRA_b [Rattus norvegicus]
MGPKRWLSSLCWQICCLDIQVSLDERCLLRLLLQHKQGWHELPCRVLLCS